MRIAIFLCALVLIGPLAGCFGDEEIIENKQWNHIILIFQTDSISTGIGMEPMQWFSNKAVPALDVQEAMIEVDTQIFGKQAHRHLMYTYHIGYLQYIGWEKVPVLQSLAHTILTGNLVLNLEQRMLLLQDEENSFSTISSSRICASTGFSIWNRGIQRLL